MGFVSSLRAKYELYRLEQRYTRRDKRTTFVSGAQYVDGEYIYADSHHGSGDDVSPSPSVRDTPAATPTSSPSTSTMTWPSSAMTGTTTTITTAPHHSHSHNQNQNHNQQRRDVDNYSVITPIQEDSSSSASAGSPGGWGQLPKRPSGTALSRRMSWRR